MPKSESFNREEVLEKVTDLFWVQGYNGTSMQDIVDATGLNRSSLYNSFGDKYQLFNESIRFYKNHVQTRSISGLDSIPPKKALRRVFDAVLTSMDDQTHTKGCFLTNCAAELATVDRDINHFLHDNMDDVLVMFEEILKRGKASGDFDKNLDERKTAIYLFSSLQGIRVTGMIMDRRSEVKALIDKTLENI